MKMKRFVVVCSLFGLIVGGVISYSFRDVGAGFFSFFAVFVFLVGSTHSIRMFK